MSNSSMSNSSMSNSSMSKASVPSSSMSSSSMSSSSMSSSSMSSTCISIRELTSDDKANWLDLWQAYLRFYKTTLSQDVTDSTWSKLLDQWVPIYGFGAFIDEKLVGFTHVVLHPNTWNLTDCCYLEDLYVNSEARGKGVGRALIEQVYQFATSHNCNRVYWVTQEGNTTSRKLYDSLAELTDMVQYRHNL